MDDNSGNGKSGRSAASCTECQRRKQKCSREWPCNHCSVRKVPQLCQFGSKRTTTITDPSVDSTRDLRRRRSSDSEAEQSRSIFHETSAIDPSEGLKAWGYMPGHSHFNVANEVPNKSSECPSAVQSQEVADVLHNVPPRSLADALVQNFFSNSNYQYYAIHPSTFLNNYTRWWTDRTSGQRLSPEFSCLLLRVCACSTQFLDSATQQKLEFELAEDSQSLGDRYHRAAEKLSATLVPGKGGLMQVQQLFLTVSWLKAEALFVESWHVLGSAIREAQELGLHKGANEEEMNEFELEMSRRLWCLLYVCDWQMSTWLSRPLIIDHSSCSFHSPNLRLEDSNSPPGLPSPFAHMALLGQLVRVLSSKFRESKDNLSPEEVSSMHEEVETWIASLPPVYSATEPDTSFDNEHPYVVLQRLTLHVTTYRLKLDPLKPYLTKRIEAVVSDNEDHFRSIGVDCCLKLLDASQQLFDLRFPMNAKFHFVVFCIFDTAAVLCSAIIHDRTSSLPQRQRVLEAIDAALHMLQQLSSMIKSGALSYNILSKLVATLPLSHQEMVFSDYRSPKRLKQTPTSPELQPITHGSPGSDDTSLPLFPVVGMPQAVASTSTADNWQYTLDPLQNQTEFGDFSGADFANLEQIWDWETLNLESLNQQGLGTGDLEG